MNKIGKKKWILPLILILMLTLAACGASNDNGGNTTNPDQGLEDNEETDVNDEQSINDKDTTVDGVKYKDAEVTPEDAFDKFINLHADAKVTEVKLDIKYDELEYKIEGYDSSNEYQVRIAAKSGDVKSDDTKELDEDDKDEGVITKDDINKINDIIDKAMKEVDENAKFKKWSLEDNDGNLEFEIEFKDKGNEDVEYIYNLESGNLKEKGD